MVWLLDIVEVVEFWEGVCVFVGGWLGVGLWDGFFGFLDGFDVVYVGDEVGVYVDEDVGGGIDYGVELGFYYDWGVGWGVWWGVWGG